jgi:hypothetical protein
VVSNLPFAAVGILGLWKLRGAFDRVLFTGVLLTFFGSAYYHLAPGDARLVWDRLPMTLVFMALLACVVSGESDSRSSRRLLAFLVTCGVASVLFWSITGDLRAAGLPSLSIPGHTIKHLLAALATYFIFRWRLAASSARPHSRSANGGDSWAFFFSSL